jgi:acetyl-CoA C-acetyltransferase
LRKPESEAFIVSAARTPIGRFGGGLSSLHPAVYASKVLKEAIKRAGIEPLDVQEVIMGNVLSAGLGQAPARQVALDAGVPESVGALTVNKVCGSGLKAAMLGAQAIRAGDLDVAACGGLEAMSRAPYLLEKARFGFKYMHGEVVDSMVRDGLWDVYTNLPMGITGEIVAERFGVTREDADQFAFESHVKAAKAQENGWFDEETLPIRYLDDKGDERVVSQDEGVRKETTLAKLAALPPAFRMGGVVTAGNSSQISDGAAALILASGSAVRKLGLKPMAKVSGYSTAGVRSDLVMEAPMPAVRALLQRMEWKIDDVDLFEHNEAFATASVAVRRELKVPEDRFNVHGGAVALGHPLGASGARILTTLVHAMKRQRKDSGLATLCLGGGNAVAMALERA